MNATTSTGDGRLILEPASQAQMSQGWKGYTPPPQKTPTQEGNPHDSPDVGKSSRRRDPAELTGTFWNISLVYKFCNLLYLLIGLQRNTLYSRSNQRATQFLQHLNLPKTPPPPKPKESAQLPELQNSEQTRTTLRQTTPLVHPASYFQAWLGLNPKDGKASQGSLTTLQVPLTTPQAHLCTGTRWQYGWPNACSRQWTQNMETGFIHKGERLLNSGSRCDPRLSPNIP